jgi:hypothetical protein
MGPPTLAAPSADRDRLLTPTHQTHAQAQLANGDHDAHAHAHAHAPTSTANGTANASSAPAVGAAAAAQQPKVVQTAFIHKLYKCVAPRLTPNALHPLTCTH